MKENIKKKVKYNETGMKYTNKSNNAARNEQLLFIYKKKRFIEKHVHIPQKWVPG